MYILFMVNDHKGEHRLKKAAKVLLSQPVTWCHLCWKNKQAKPTVLIFFQSKLIKDSIVLLGIHLFFSSYLEYLLHTGAYYW